MGVETLQKQTWLGVTCDTLGTVKKKLGFYHKNNGVNKQENKNIMYLIAWNKNV